MAKSRTGLGDRAEAATAGLDELPTEAGSDPSADYEALGTRELVELMNAADATVPTAVSVAAAAIAVAVDAISERMARGGRLIYAGAGSSGRIAALDASECESTFGAPPGTVAALM